MTKIYITHGYTANGDKHWFPWLEQKLAEKGLECQRLTMPNSANPTPQAWLKYHQEKITLDENTILIGHSLGCLATLNFLAAQQQKIKGAIFVSGFYEKLPNLPELDIFADFYANLTAYKPEKAFVVASLDDHIVPHQYSDHLAQLLDADYIRLPKGGHFLDREGVTELPIVLELVGKLL